MISQGWPLWAVPQGGGTVYAVVGWEPEKDGSGAWPVLVSTASGTMRAFTVGAYHDPLTICTSEQDARSLAGGDEQVAASLGEGLGREF